MPASRTQGDLKLLLTEEGVDLDFNGGQPTMDPGLGTAVILTLLSASGWAGNALLPASQQVGGNFEEVINQPLQLSTLVKAENTAKTDLEWLIKAGVAEDVRVTVSNPVDNFIEVVVLVIPPGGSAQEIQLTKNGENWILQTTEAERSER